MTTTSNTTETENEALFGVGSSCRQNPKFENFTSLFTDYNKKNAPKCVPHVQHGYFSLFKVFDLCPCRRRFLGPLQMSPVDRSGPVSEISAHPKQRLDILKFSFHHSSDTTPVQMFCHQTSVRPGLCQHLCLLRFRRLCFIRFQLWRQYFRFCNRAARIASWCFLCCIFQH